MVIPLQEQFPLTNTWHEVSPLALLTTDECTHPNVPVILIRGGDEFGDGPLTREFNRWVRRVINLPAYAEALRSKGVRLVLEELVTRSIGFAHVGTLLYLGPWWSREHTFWLAVTQRGRRATASADISGGGTVDAARARD